MEKAIPSWTLKSIADALGGAFSGDPDLTIERPVPAGNPDPHGITFAESAKYLAKVEGSGVGAVIIGPAVADPGIPYVRVDEPRAAFFQLLLMAQERLERLQGIHPSAVVAASAQVAPSASIGPGCVIEAGAVIGDSVWLRASVFVGANASIGSRTVLHPNVTLYEHTIVGADCILHAGVVIGADGFGYAWDGRIQVKVPQVGRVVIGDNCEIGANTCIDRATCGETIVGPGTKLDNLVQIGHNVLVGKDTVIASLVGVSGSCEIGDRVTVAGQVGMNDHVRVGDDVTLGGRTGVVDDITEPGAYFGTPALPVREGLRQLAVLRRLPELLERVKVLEAEIEKLRTEQ